MRRPGQARLHRWGAEWCKAHRRKSRRAWLPVWILLLSPCSSSSVPCYLTKHPCLLRFYRIKCEFFRQVVLESPWPIPLFLSHAWLGSLENPPLSCCGHFYLLFFLFFLPSCSTTQQKDQCKAFSELILLPLCCGTSKMSYIVLYLILTVVCLLGPNFH